MYSWMSSKMGRVRSKTRSNLSKTLLIKAIPHNPESSCERLQGRPGALVYLFDAMVKNVLIN